MSFGIVKDGYSQPVFEMVGVAAGQQHSMILSKDGSLYSWGLGLCGQLGFSYEDIHQNDLRIA